MSRVQPGVLEVAVADRDLERVQEERLEAEYLASDDYRRDMVLCRMEQVDTSCTSTG